MHTLVDVRDEDLQRLLQRGARLIESPAFWIIWSIGFFPTFAAFVVLDPDVGSWQSFAMMVPGMLLVIVLA